MKSDSKSFIPLLIFMGAALLALGAKAVSKFILPVKGLIASAFGERINPITNKKEFHNGIDISVPEGTSVLSPMSGKVTNVYSTAIGGNQIVISHPSGYVTGYAHLKKSVVSIGEKVSRGQMIAYSGRTGQTTGAHLHFSLRDKSGKYIDPEKVFPFIV